MRGCRAIGLFSFVLSVAASMPSSAASFAQQDEKAVKQAAEQFYTALNGLFQGELDQMKAIWSHADDVTYMGPGGGIQRGWDAVLANWETQAAKKLGGKVRPEKAQITVGPEFAIFSCYEVGENVVDGKPQPVSIRATNIFRKENGQWKMVGHHTDLLPYLEQ